MTNKKRVRKMTLEEKARICTGANVWETVAVPRLKIPKIMMTDGPHGVRKEDMETPNVDGFNQHNSYRATCFPAESCIASSFSAELLGKVGRELGRQARAFGVRILLGPGINLKRLPIGGRNFEYFSEDPYLTGILAEAYVKGVQSCGVACSLKHFFANNTELNRTTIDIRMDERTRRELYLAAFEYVVRRAKPMAVMAAYNKANGEFCSENRELLDSILRKEWGFDGIVMSDWWAMHDRVKGINAGCNLEMPFVSDQSWQSVVTAVREGRLDEAQLDRMAEGMVRLARKVGRKRRKIAFDPKLGHAVALDAARQSIVLLKNENHLLPLRKDSFCVIGALARFPMFQGAGSSKVNPFQVDFVLDCLRDMTGREIPFASGYRLAESEMEEESALTAEAISLASRHEVTVVFAGLPEGAESESRDRKDIELPENQNSLIREICCVCKKVIVILQTGSVVALPWKEEAGAILQAGLYGESGGQALAEILTGEISPSGRLAETYVKRLEDVPAMKHYDEDPDCITYGEGLDVGYRYFESAGIEVNYPFGYGLSYTEFSYSEVSGRSIEAGIRFSLKIRNCGNFDAHDTLMVFAEETEENSGTRRKALKGICRTFLRRGEEKKLSFCVGWERLRRYDTERNVWIPYQGIVRFFVAKNAAETITECCVGMR